MKINKHEIPFFFKNRMFYGKVIRLDDKIKIEIKSLPNVLCVYNLVLQ